MEPPQVLNGKKCNTDNNNNNNSNINNNLADVDVMDGWNSSGSGDHPRITLAGKQDRRAVHAGTNQYSCTDLHGLVPVGPGNYIAATVF